MLQLRCHLPLRSDLSDVSPRIQRMLWMVPAEVQLEWRTWGESSVVFNQASGDTHLLDSVAAEVLERLETRSASIDELCERFRELMEPPPDTDHDLSPHIQTLVAKLEDLGLIVSIRS